MMVTGKLFMMDYLYEHVRYCGTFSDQGGNRYRLYIGNLIGHGWVSFSVPPMNKNNPCFRDYQHTLTRLKMSLMLITD